MTDLRFTGDWPLWQAALAAAAAAALTWALYRRQLSRGVMGKARWLLPMLRSAAIVLIVLMLAGPVLHHRQVIGELSRLWIMVDGSSSMGIVEPHLPLERKMLWLIDAGWLPPNLLSERDRATEQTLADACRGLASSGRPLVADALARFDRLSRWERLQATLLDPQHGLLRKLASEHEVRLVAMEGQTARPIWHSAGEAPLPDTLSAADGATTDLSMPLRNAAGLSTASTARGAIVVFSDGRHNTGPSPIEAAKLLGASRLPVHTVAYGSRTPPPDLALAAIEGPDSVHRQDRLRAVVTIHDQLPAGTPFTLRLEHEGRIVQQVELTSQGNGARRIPIDLPIAPLVEARLASMDKDVRAAMLPMTLTATLQPLAAEARPDNNARQFHFRAVTSEQKLLILDGRLRWETRYVRNMFERDPRWKTHTIIAGPSAEQPAIRRGANPGEFPAERRALFSYDLIVLGELPADLLSPQEQEWLRDFVSVRGGGLIFIDGPRGLLRGWAEGPVGTLIPVRWGSGEGHRDASELEPTDLGRRRAEFALASAAPESAATWKALAPPRWIADAAPVEGASQTLVEAVSGGRRTPLIVERRAGMGKAIWCGTDELWRWRYEAADRFHVRLWHQLATAAMEEPFAVADQFVSLDAGKTVYAPGESAPIRARLRDGQGKPVTAATVEAVLKRDGQTAHSVLLNAEDSDSGLFAGRTPPLAPGQYDVSIRVSGVSEDRLRASTRLIVQAPPSPELAELTCGTELLEQMAGAAGGRAIPEEQAHQLVEILQPLTAGRVIESDTILWQGYGWFAPIVALLAAEWFLRKRWGLM